MELWGAPMPCAWPVTPDMKNPAHYPVAVSKACYVGDAVAVVLATSEAAAQDAVGAIDVQYEPLDAVIGLEDALSDQVVIHDDLGTNKSYTWELKVGEEAVDAAFASAAHTVKERYIQQRLIPMAMEPRAVAAVPQPYGGDMTLYSATQIPHILKIMTALTLSHPEHQMRSWRRASAAQLRLEAQRVRGGAALRRPRQEARRARALERGADGEARHRSRAAGRSRTSSWRLTPTAS
jgi:carbon-monoxide dehydrogenase large subunit